MAYVPGYQHDVFVSYAHGDDREWINRFVQHLNSALDRRLGTKTSVWIDEDSNRKTRDYTREIPESACASAVFLLLPSPTYIRSAYCVEQECRVFAETVDARRARFATPAFANELFAARCPILPIDGNDHWSLFRGLTDIAFCDESGTFAIGSPEFEERFAQLAGELVDLLKRMRNQSTSVFLYPPSPGSDLVEVHRALLAELTAQSYRVLPDRMVNLAEQLRGASVAVFLLGPTYVETGSELVDVAKNLGKPWIVWCSPGVDDGDANQIGLCAHVEQLESPSKTYLGAGTLPAKLKEEVLAVLKPTTPAQTRADEKPSVYLVYNRKDPDDQKNAGLISFNFRKDFHFQHPDDPALHMRRLSHSNGVLLVWGHADEDWCSREFLEMVQAACRSEARGLCLFDPREPKHAAVEEIRKTFGDAVYIGEQFGRFESARLETFFAPIRRRPQEDRP